MQNQLPLFLPYDQLRDLPIIRKYEKIFYQLDLSDLPEFNRGIGAKGISQRALLRSFLIRSLESLKTVPALMRFLQANPALIFLCGFKNQVLPHDSQFYRFLKKLITPPSKIFLSRPIKFLSKIRCFHYTSPL